MDIETKWGQRKEQFLKLWPQKYSDKVENIWVMLSRHYSESHRFYHTRGHILECLDQFDKIENLLLSKDAVQLSIWFHDVIYDVKASDNEEQSAAFFSHIAKGLLPETLIKEVYELIISTKHMSAPPNCDQAFLLDIDLSSFGSDLEKFFLNGKNLRKEVPHLTDQQFSSGQMNFLQMLLNRKQIFFTDFFRQKYESIAIRNINLQIQQMHEIG